MEPLPSFVLVQVHHPLFQLCSLPNDRPPANAEYRLSTSRTINHQSLKYSREFHYFEPTNRHIHHRCPSQAQEHSTSTPRSSITCVSKAANRPSRLHHAKRPRTLKMVSERMVMLVSIGIRPNECLGTLVVPVPAHVHISFKQVSRLRRRAGNATRTTAQKGIKS
jgi:hypothetical protein